MASCQLRYVVPLTQCLIARTQCKYYKCSNSDCPGQCLQQQLHQQAKIWCQVISMDDINNDEFSCCTFASSHWSHLQLTNRTSDAPFRYVMHKLPCWSLTLCCCPRLTTHRSNIRHLIHMQEICAQCVHLCMFCSYPPSVAVVQELTPYQESRKLVAMPSPLEWLSYIFASGNLLAGPFFELRDYRDYIQRQGAWAGGFPSGLLPGVVRLLKALLCMAFHLRMTQGFNASTLESAWYYSQPLWSRCVSH